MPEGVLYGLADQLCFVGYGGQHVSSNDVAILRKDGSPKFGR